MNRRIMQKLRHFNTEYNCDCCCLKENKECNADKEYCAVKFDTVEVVHHKKAEDKAETTTTQNEVLCGQGRCQECTHTLC